MKKTLILLFALVASLTFIGCEESTAPETTVAETTTEATTTEATTTETTTTEVTTTEATTILETTTEEVTTLPTTTAAQVTSIEITNQTTKFFRLGEEFDKDTIELTAHLDDGTSEIVPSELFSVRSFSSSSIGEKTITIIYDRYMLQTTVYILEDFAVEIDMEYYEDALNLQGDQLKVTLNNIINDGFTGLLYDAARDILQESDEDPNNASNIILVYTNLSVTSTWDGGTTWNREHVWPQSRLGAQAYGSTTANKATDVHNLKPANPAENSERSNDYFSTVDGPDFYEPRDAVKGDIARILFYMTTMYFDLSLNDNEASSPGLKTMGMISMLLEWNELDPVDDFERNRNEVIYTYQGNRNPFVDYPEFVDLIWGTE